MDGTKQNEVASIKNRSTLERTSDRELTITRTINGPARLVFEAWTKAELFQQWWVPKSIGLTLLSCEVDARVGGKYRLVFKHPQAPEPMAFFGTYLEVTPCSRLSWTNEESGPDGQVTTATFDEKAGKTLVIVRELYPSKEVLDAALESGSTAGDMNETFDQLDAFLASKSAIA